MMNKILIYNVFFVDSSKTNSNNSRGISDLSVLGKSYYGKGYWNIME